MFMNFQTGFVFEHFTTIFHLHTDSLPKKIERRIFSSCPEIFQGTKKLRALQSDSAGLIRSIHFDLFGIVRNVPDAARTHARANSATDTLRRVRNVFPCAVVAGDSAYRLFGATVQAHFAIATRAATDATQMFMLRSGQVAMMAFLEEFLRQVFGRDDLRLSLQSDFFAAKELGNRQCSPPSVADCVRQSAGFDNVTRRKNFRQNRFVGIGNKPIAELFHFGQEVKHGTFAD